MGFCSKINILYIITKLELGGAQKQLLELVRGLDKDKFNPCIIAAREGFLTQEAGNIPGVQLIRCKFLERPIRPVKDILALFFIYRFIKNNKIDIVHTHSSKAGILGRLAAKAAGVRIIIHTVHGWSFHDHQSPVFYYLYSFLEKVCAYLSNAIIVVSDFDKKRALQKGIGERDKYRLIRYSVDRVNFRKGASPLTVRKEFGLSVSDLVVGTIACFKPQKAPLDFIKIAGAVNKDLPGVKFLFVGDGVLRKDIRALINKLGLEKQITLTGWRRDIPAVLSCLDVFVLTSLWEGMPIVALEAIASCVPVIVTDTGGVGEIIVNGKTGHLSRPGDIQFFRDRLKELLMNPGLRKEFAAAAESSLDFDEYSPANMVKNTTQLYLDLLSGERNA